MNDCTISIFNNKIFFQIISEAKLFSKYQVKYYEDMDLCIKDAEAYNQLTVFFVNSDDQIKKNNFPSIFITESSMSRNKLSNGLNEQIKIPFAITEFERKVISIISKDQFKKNSLIKLNDYIIDKNERKIKKNNIELQLSEKEINFLILFSHNKEPISKNLVLKNVWNYSSDAETHTIETHIHRLRKKIFEKFGDNNFIKNNSQGYFT